MTLRLTALNIYPIKSAAGIAAGEWDVDDFGLRYDRRWMVVDSTGMFLTQRDYPRMALISPSVSGTTLSINAPHMSTLELPLNPGKAVSTRVTVWRDSFSATWVGQKAAEWFTDFLGLACSLVHMSEDVVRPTNPDFAPGGRVSFADGYPFLLISEESLHELNSRLSEAVPMNRFRPNLVVAGAAPYAEDDWTRIKVGNVPLRVVKPCFRCVITTTDQLTTRRTKEPLRTLATYRRVGGEVMFGQNAVHEGVGRLGVGDSVSLL
jgi:uncharacterized protein YcbX